MEGFGIINLDEELKELFKREEVFAIFDLQLVIGEGESFTGLCVILKSKFKEAGLRYFSFIFIIDSPDIISSARIKKTLSGIDLHILMNRIPELKKEISFTNPESTARHCYYEVYLYFDDSSISLERLLADRIYQELKGIKEFRIGDLIFYNE